MSTDLRITNHEITLRLRDVPTPHLRKLPRLYPNDARALPLILSEIKRRSQQRIIPQPPTR